jgi:hypothetical protein
MQITKYIYIFILSDINILITKTYSNEILLRKYIFGSKSLNALQDVRSRSAATYLPGYPEQELEGHQRHPIKRKNFEPV